ncbi:NADH:ubiquinone reductase (Na(+)-transporting) subunit E [Candidatus Marinamargulisbacteria bacterium SCGC AG-439-L15]|nr:NADH:ubiquinone reductase (Na(+)-transporting) subunit E [Candidatus Marinamargulisbacteria bacterium SCGC AG-439-L15]
MENLLSLAVKAIFMENMLLAMFLGMCSFLACSKNIKTANGLGWAVCFVLTITVPMNWAINHYLLRPGALTWMGLPTIDLSFLVFISFIATIAASVQIVEMFMEKFLPFLYSTLGIFLPLIAVNCSILGGSLFMEQRQYGFAESVVFGFSSGIGWLLAIVAMAAIQEKLQYSDVPKGLRGFGINMIITGLISMAFMAFSGIAF